MSEDLIGNYQFHAPYPVGYVPSAEEQKYVFKVFTDYMESTHRLSEDQINTIMNTNKDNLVGFVWYP